MGNVTDPFKHGGDEPEVEDPPTDSPVSLADAAQSALGNVAEEDGAAQGELEGMDYTKVKFVGVQYDDLESDVKIGDEMEFLVKGQVVGVGDEKMSDGHVRHFAKVKVSSVVLRDEK